MTVRASVGLGAVTPGDHAEMKEFYTRHSLPPYLQAATTEQTSPAGEAGEALDRSRSEGQLNEVSAVGEADAAAGETSFSFHGTIPCCVC